MELLLIRTHKIQKATLGKLYVNGLFECYTLEDLEREIKIKHNTAIPKGKYKIIITHSNRFNKPLPLLLNVPNFEGIRIHSGNNNTDTSGCILVGTYNVFDTLIESRKAFKQLFNKLQNQTEIYISIQ